MPLSGLDTHTAGRGGGYLGRGPALDGRRYVVREAVADDLAAICALLARSGLSSAQPEILKFYSTAPGSRVFAACCGDQVAGTAASVSFGRSGWLGSVAVDQAWRGRGLGTAVSKAALDCLLDAGVETVLLTATDMGRPVYDRLGFVDEGISYGIWERERPYQPGGKSADGVRPGGIEDAVAYDAKATGEDRREFLEVFASRVRVPSGPEQSGYRIALPWGGGPVIATAPASAQLLLTDMVTATQGMRLVFPERNTHGAELASSLGFCLARRVTRMRLGPPVSGYRPEMIYNVWGLAVG
jgi:GNAT superfamily N-acetyltransferase